MSTHDSVRSEFVAYITGEASDETVSAVREHLATCAECRGELKELEFAAQLVSQSPAELNPPEGLEDRTFQLIEGRAPGVVGRGDTIGAPVPIAKGQEIREVRERRRRRPLIAMLAPGVAAALVLLGFIGARLYQDNQDLRSQLAQQSERFGELGSALDTVKLASAESPDVQAVAKIYKLENDNYQIVLDAQNFPESPVGYQYELWLGGDDGWVSAGTFKTTGAEHMKFQLHVAADPSLFPKVDLTVEPIDGNPGHTGPAIMQGELNPTTL